MRFFHAYREPTPDKPGCWRVLVDHSDVGGGSVDICMAVNEMVAAETALLMSEFRKANP